MEELSQTFDVCVICALYEEARAVLREFAIRCHVSFTRAQYGPDRYDYRYTTIKNRSGESLTIFVTWLPQMGPVAMAQELKLLIQQFRPRFVAMTGICAGDRRQVQLGDLVIASAAYHYEEGKVLQKAEGQASLQPASSIIGPSDQVLQYARSFQGWKKAVGKMQRTFLAHMQQPFRPPYATVAPMASGMAVRADDPFPWLQEHYHRQTTALDMESASFYQALRSSAQALVVKGVCDYADQTKNDSYHNYAARISAVYLLSFIREYVTWERMPRQEDLSRREAPTFWNVPYPRNQFFFGRQTELSQINQHLRVRQAAALAQPQAISGLGGIGKTQLALEYAYLHQRDYQAVLWTRAESREALVSSFLALARVLRLPEREAREREIIVQAVKNWLQTHQRWLLILDNADELAWLPDFLPSRLGGHLLLTTRAAATGQVAHRLEIETLEPEPGALFLLRRATLMESDATLEQASHEERKLAIQISQELGGLLLALDQAGAFLEETGTSLSEYWQIYQRHRADLLRQRRGLVKDHPAPVATTWSLSFQLVEEKNPVAADLLRLCAFLSPDAIPDEILIAAVPVSTSNPEPAEKDLYPFIEAIEALRAYSLVRRNPQRKILSIHRLVQVVLRGRMEETEQKAWAERTVEAVNAVFPSGDPETWRNCQRSFAQVQSCIQLINQYHLNSPVVASLLHRAGYYLYKRATYDQAQVLLTQALAMRETLRGPQQLDLAETLLTLGMFCYEQGKFHDSLLFLRRAQAIYEEPGVPSDRSRQAEVFMHLGYSYSFNSQWDEAETFYKRALEIYQQRDGALSLSVATGLCALAEYCDDRERYREAEEFYQRALDIRSEWLKPDHPDLAEPLYNLGSIYQRQCRYSEAEPLLQRALAIGEKALGPEHRITATYVQCLGMLYRALGRYDEAERLLQRVLQLRLSIFGPHPDTANTMNHLVLVYREQGRSAEAEILARQALAMQEKYLGIKHVFASRNLYSLGMVLIDLEQYQEAEQLLQQALIIRERDMGVDHSWTAISLNGLAVLYCKQGRYDEAEQLFQRALNIRKHVWKSHHPEIAETLHDLAGCCERQNKYREALELYQHAFTIRQKVLGAEHPHTRETRWRLTTLRRLSEPSDGSLNQSGTDENEQAPPSGKEGGVRLERASF